MMDRPIESGHFPARHPAVPGREMAKPDDIMILLWGREDERVVVIQRGGRDGRPNPEGMETHWLRDADTDARSDLLREVLHWFGDG